MWMTPCWRAAVGLAIVCTCACTSALENFEAGQQLESTGEYARAAERYIAALERDPALAEARTRLEALAPRVLVAWLEQARLDRERGRAVGAAEWFQIIDEFVAGARRVGVAPVQDPAYPYERRGAFDAAVERLFVEGAAERERGGYDLAVTAFDQIPRFEPNPASQQRLREERAETRLKWARSEFAAGRFRAAFGQADLVIAELGAAAPPWAGLADALRAEALEVGTVRVVVLPLTRHPTATGPSAATLGAIEDELVLGAWQDPPPFVALLDQAVVRSYLRREGYTVADLTPRDAGDLGRELGADVIVIPKIGDPAFREDEADVQRRTAQTADGAPATFRFIRARLRGELAIDFTLVAAGRGRAVGEYRADTRVDGRVERAEYDGDWTDLRLSGAVQRLFNGETVADAERELETRGVPGLAERFGDAVFRRVLAQVP